MIHVNPNELRQAFWCHLEKRAAAESLLLFYAVECGLKSLYLRQRNLRSTEMIADDLKSRGHDLRRWFKELRLPATMALPQGFRLRRDETFWDLGRAHEAWRYGAAVHSDDEGKLLEALERVRVWIQEALPQ